MILISIDYTLPRHSFDWLFDVDWFEGNTTHTIPCTHYDLILVIVIIIRALPVTPESRVKGPWSISGMKSASKTSQHRWHFGTLFFYWWKPHLQQALFQEDEYTVTISTELNGRTVTQTVEKFPMGQPNPTWFRTDTISYLLPSNPQVLFFCSRWSDILLLEVFPWLFRINPYCQRS